MTGDGNSRAQLARATILLNRPREALGILEKVNWRWAEVSDSPYYWTLASEAHHLLGEFDESLEALQTARRRFPTHPYVMQVDAIALAILGREDELQKLKSEARAAASTGREYGDLLYQVAAEQLLHGDSTRSVTTAGEAVAWYESRPPSEAAGLRWWHVGALVMAGRPRDAVALLPGPCAQADWECHANTGVIAATLGDTAGARRATEALARMTPTPRVDQGPPAWGLCIIAAAQGEYDRAVENLRDAHAKGLGLNWAHWSLALFPKLQRHPGFQEFMRPKG